MTLKIKDKKLFGRNCILDSFITRKFEFHGVFLCIFPDPDPGDPKSPDPTGSGSATLALTILERGHSPVRSNEKLL